MKAITVRTFGDAGQLRSEEVPEPQAGPVKVTIDVAFAGVGLVDTLMRSGALDFVRLPLIPGIEVSGPVRSLGEGVAGLAPGRRVAALLTDFTDGGMGGYAEVARAKAGLVVALDDEDDLATAAGTVVNGATAFLAMEGLAAGSAAAISGASGGLGQRLVATARHAGAGIIVAVSSNEARAATLRRLGATEVVSSRAFAAASQPIDAAFDTVGGSTRLDLLRRLAPAGRLVLLGNASGRDVALPGDEVWLRSLRVEGLSTGGLSPLIPDRIGAAARAAITDARAYPTDFATVPLGQAAEAHRMVERGQGPGKLVLNVG